MKPAFALPLADVLSRHKIPGANLVPVEAASHLRDAPDIFELMLPKRRIHFDAECISDADDLERVVGYFADATEGTWNLSELSARLNHDAETGFIDFDSDGTSFHWEFKQYGDYVSGQLLERLQVFARTHLPGDFIEVPTPDQCYCAIYLERPAAEDLRALLEAYKQEFSHWL